MVIDRASIFADRFKDQPQILQAAVLGPSPVPGLDPYTALRAVQLLKESAAMNAARAAQQPTNTPSLVQTAMQMPQMPPQMARPAPQPQPQAAPQGMASGGLAALPSGSHDYALGGMVSFADRGLVSGDEDNEEQLVSDGSPGDPERYAQAQTDLNAIMQRILANPKVQMMSPAKRREFITKYMEDVQGSGGESPYAAMRQDIETARGESAKNLDRAQGMALLEAAAAAVQPGGTVRGLAGAAAAFGGSYGKALQADRSEKRNLANMQFQLADAERKERMGLYREARMAADAADKSAVEAARDARTRDIEAAKIKVGEIKATRPAAVRPPASPKLAEQLAAAEIAFEKNPTPENEQTVLALRRTAAALKTTDVGPTRAGLTEAELNRRIDEMVAADVNKFARMPSLSPVYKEELRAAKTALSQAQQTNDPDLIAKRQAEVKAVIKKYETDRREYYRKNPSLLMQTAAPASAATAAPAASSSIDFSQLPTAKP